MEYLVLLLIVAGILILALLIALVSVDRKFYKKHRVIIDKYNTLPKAKKLRVKILRNDLQRTGMEYLEALYYAIQLEEFGWIKSVFKKNGDDIII